VRQVDVATGMVTTLAGDGTAGFRDGPADTGACPRPNFSLACHSLSSRDERTVQLRYHGTKVALMPSSPREKAWGRATPAWEAEEAECAPLRT
jgi:hypothetical protein